MNVAKPYEDEAERLKDVKYKAQRNSDAFVNAIFKSVEKRPPNDSRKSSSFSAQVSDLEVGESAIKNIQIDLRLMDTANVEGMAERREQMRNNVASPIRAAKERTGGTYSTELTDVFLPSGRLFIVAVVTRMS